MSLEQELQTERVNHLNLRGFSLVAGDTPVDDVLKQMREGGHSVCLITEGGRLAGVFTDRDVMRKVAGAPDTWSKPVSEVMTPRPITVGHSATAAEALYVMDEHHFRNLPVTDEKGGIVGNMTYRAVIDYLASRYPVEVLNRPPRPEQFPRRAEGG